MDGRRVFLFAALCVSVFVTTEAWSGNVCSRSVCRYVTERVCAYNTWAACCYWKYVRVPRYVTEYYCCPGWSQSSSQNCNVPICNPACQNGGTCTAPNVCRCPVQFSGDTCGGPVCSHVSPCFPGDCKAGIQCDCSSGFRTKTVSAQDFCLQIEDNNADLRIYELRVNLSSIKPGNGMLMYSVTLDASNATTDVFYTNRGDFNRLEANCSSQYFVPVIPPQPLYVRNYAFGVVQGAMQVWLQKLPPVGQTTRPPPSLNETRNCQKVVSNIQPEKDLFLCAINNPTFDRLLEHGDIMKVTFVTKGGGYRDLFDRNTNSPYRTQEYISIERALSVELHFDFRAPTHCAESNTCRGGETMLTVPDITKTPVITITWSGWTDDDSKMGRYSMEVFKMTKAAGTQVEIRNEEALKPLINREVNHTTGQSRYTQEYTLPEAGMYSVILEISDLANNTKHVRRLVLYDPSPVITSENAFNVTSANPASNYTYQLDPSAPITVTWDGHFRNALHEDNNFLGAVRRYPEELRDLMDPKAVYLKTIPQEPTKKLDDYEGTRTINEVPNKRGIVNFKVAHAKDSDGGSSQAQIPAPSLWTDLGLKTTFTLPPTVNPTRGDTVTIWVKTTDFMGSEKVERRQVSFDSTPPVVNEFQFRMNTNVEGIDFSSTFDLRTDDPESGIAFVLWTFTRKNGTVIYTEKVFGKRVQSCPDTSKCVCTRGDVHCFSRDQSFSLTNCHMMVEKANLPNEVITLTADVTNMAGLVTRRNMTKDQLTSLNGTQQYFPPQNIKVADLTRESAKITWDYPPSCFARTGFWVIINDVKHAVHVDARDFVLSGLTPETSYTIYLVTDFVGGVQSDKAQFAFITAEKEGLGGGAIAGIIIGLLILLVLIILVVVFVLYRRRVILQQPGPVNKQLNRMSHAFDNVRRMTTHRRDAFSNSAYRGDDDEVYLYGHMAFNTHQKWQLSDHDLTLQDHIAEGKFANIYKASWRHDGRSDTVAVKMLKTGFSEDDGLKMMAKINFFATQFEDHDNVIRFIGAVTDNSSWGPVMVMEFCENGQMDKWLANNRKNASDQVIENILRFALGVAKGMEYLASKKITHRRLAARNVLLTFILDAKVAGFGPQQKEGEEDKMTRVPAKWAAPEVLAEKPATEKSDVWSFGIVLWEIFSMGQVPYPNIHANEVGTRLRGGYRMDKPEFADDIHYEVMKECWEYKPARRPTFKTARARLEQHFAPGNRQSVDFYYDTNQLGRQVP